MKIIVTGAGGFIGKNLLFNTALDPNIEVRAVFREINKEQKSPYELVEIEDINSGTNWKGILEDIDTVIHLAERAHFTTATEKNSQSKFSETNIEGTLNLASQSVEKGVKRFIFLSSIKVNGEKTLLNSPFTSEDSPQPEDFYGKLKLETEKRLKEITRKETMELVIIRPVMVYGPGVKANFLNLITWISKGLPLPFGSVRNKRSFVSVHNLIDFILLCVNHPSAANETFLVSDGKSISTTELIENIKSALGKGGLNFPLPLFILKVILFISSRSNLSQKLLGSLEVDISKNKEILGWEPSISFEESLNLTIEHFLKKQ